MEDVARMKIYELNCRIAELEGELKGIYSSNEKKNLEYANIIKENYELRRRVYDLEAELDYDETIKLDSQEIE